MSDTYIHVKPAIEVQFQKCMERGRVLFFSAPCGFGKTVTAEKLIAVQDWRKHNVTNYAYGVVKIFVQCKYESGEFEDNIETTGIAFFDEDTLPENLAVEKCTREQILMCFAALQDPNAPTVFD